MFYIYLLIFSFICILGYCGYREFYKVEGFEIDKYYPKPRIINGKDTKYKNDAISNKSQNFVIKLDSPQYKNLPPAPDSYDWDELLTDDMYYPTHEPTFTFQPSNIFLDSNKFAANSKQFMSNEKVETSRTIFSVDKIFAFSTVPIDFTLTISNVIKPDNTLDSPKILYFRYVPAEQTGAYDGGSRYSSEDARRAVCAFASKFDEPVQVIDVPKIKRNGRNMKCKVFLQHLKQPKVLVYDVDIKLPLSMKGEYKIEKYKEITQEEEFPYKSMDSIKYAETSVLKIM